MTIKPLELTAESFKEFGSVLSSEVGAPAADNDEIKYWGKLSQFSLGSDVSTGIMYVKKRQPVLESFERHLQTPEMLVALEGDSVVCFAKKSPYGSDEIGEVKAFYIKQGDAFVMSPGTWHWAGYPKNDAAKFLVVFKYGTEEKDLEVKNVSEKVTVDI